MHRHSPLSVVALALLACSLPVAADSLQRATPRESGFSPQRLERLTGTLEHYVSSQQLAGSVTLVLRHGTFDVSEQVIRDGRALFQRK